MDWCLRRSTRRTASISSRIFGFCCGESFPFFTRRAMRVSRPALDSRVARSGMQAGAGKGVDALPSPHCDIFVRHFVEVTWNEIGRRLRITRASIPKSIPTSKIRAA
jgi:hypothetical protein